MMRQITLGAALISIGFNPILFCFSIPDALVVRAKEFGLTVHKRLRRCDSPDLSIEIFSTNCNVVVFDGYEFSRDMITEVFRRNIQVVLVDDNGDLANFPCHLILNQNFHADASMYAKNKSDPELLIGLSWALIRPEVAAQIPRMAGQERSGILLSVGGTDHLGITKVLREALMQGTKEEVIATNGLSSGSNFSPLDMAIAMSRVKVGVISCGTTMWEAICLKLPFVGLLTASNQIQASESLRHLSSIHFVDVTQQVDVTKIVDQTLSLLKQQSAIDEFSRQTSGLIDGLGPSRVAHRFYEMFAV